TKNLVTQSKAISTSSHTTLLPALTDVFILLKLRQPPRPTFFPYTTLFRSRHSNSGMNLPRRALAEIAGGRGFFAQVIETGSQPRSEEHTSELQSRGHLVCRLLLEKKNQSNKCSRSWSN